MKRDFLKELGLDAETIDKIMAEHGKDVTAAKADADAKTQTIAARDTEINGLKEQLSQRDADIKALRDGAANADELKSQLETLQGKYKTDTDELNKKLKDQQTGFERQTATDKFFAEVKFSSELAKKAAVADFKEKGLKLENGAFVGGKEWLEELKKNEPTAFASEEPDGADPFKPNFGGSTKPNNRGTKPDENPFGFTFSHVRKIDKE